jgi:L-ascorbate metabolism protein UlaG (beta-lactamase superfamily)
MPCCRVIFLLPVLIAIMMVVGRAGEGLAQNAAVARKPSTCLAIANRSDDLPVMNAAFVPVQARMPSVNIRYVTHSTFRIEAPGGVIAATDYAGRAGAGRLPDIVTMNHAHGTHYTNAPDQGIAHVLPGWGEFGKGIDHWLEVDDLLVRNVSTDIYRGGVLIESDGNSIFVFEVAGLCIGHMGHLHHTLTPEHIAEIGRLDVLMLPVDGSVTMSVEGMSDLARQFRSSVILPMHWFSSFSLQRFLDEIGTAFEVRIAQGNDMDVSLDSLPSSPTVVVLNPEFGTALGFD